MKIRGETIVKLNILGPIFNFCIVHCEFSYDSSNCLPKNAKSHWLQLSEVLPLCLFKCGFKLLYLENAESHRLHLVDFSPLWVFEYALAERMQSHIDCIYFLSSTEFSNVSLNCLLSNADCIFLFFSTVHSQMYTQITCLRKCICQPSNTNLRLRNAKKTQYVVYFWMHLLNVPSAKLTRRKKINQDSISRHLLWITDRILSTVIAKSQDNISCIPKDQPWVRIK